MLYHASIKRYKSSTRGLTFSILPDNQYFPGSHYIYEVRRNCIIIRPSKEGMTVSRKKCGNNMKALFDIRRSDVRETVSHCDYLEIEMIGERIIVRCIREIRTKIVSLEKVLREFYTSNEILEMAAGLEGQITLDQYLSSISHDSTFSNIIKGAVDEDIHKVFSVMSLFSGAGMLDWPFFKDPNFAILFACDYDSEACESYRHNIGNHILCGDVRDVSGFMKPYNVIIGGPSCKPFSSSNRRKRLASHEDVDLVNEYIRITMENYPEVFVIENVPQFISCREGLYLSRVLERLGNSYRISASIVKDCNVGGYTTRKRSVILGSRIGKIQLPQIVVHPIKTVKEALAKVTDDWINFSDQTINRPETVRNMSYVKPGHNYKDVPWLKDKPNMHSDRYYRLDTNKPCPTIVNWRKLPLIHPKENRTLTVAEASALMGFGKDFGFYGSLNSRQQQCGNGCTLAIGTLIKNAVKRALLHYHTEPALA